MNIFSLAIFVITTVALGYCDDCACCENCTLSTATPKSSCVICKAGFFLNSTTNVCMTCPVGYFCPTSSNEAILCKRGYYSSETGLSECLLCPSGHECKLITEISDVSFLDPIPCDRGYYSREGDGLCYSCLTGFYSNTKASQTCTSCPAGFYCVNSSSSPVECDRGSYSYEAVISCTECPPGFYTNSSGATSCTVCPQGYKCSAPSADPVVCPVGMYSKRGSISCLKCPDGYYQDATGQSACDICPGGHSCANVSDSPVECPLGTFSSAGSVSCSDCPIGYYSNETGKTNGCNECPPGSSCQDVIFPLPCAEGSYSVGRQTVCSLCPYGYYSNQTSSTSCNECPAGHSCNNSAINPLPCPRGTYSLSKSVKCTNCPSGHYSDATGSYECKRCPSGFFCNDSSVDPVICSAGTYSQAGSMVCLDCPVGYFGNETGQSVCKACPAGYECSSGQPKICSAGTISLERAINCTLCVPGHTYSSSPGQSECSGCQIGYTCENPAEEPSNESCIAGWYYSAINRCQQCPPGTYSNTTGATSCSLCPAGHQCPNFASITYHKCSAGMFSLIGSLNCTQCSTGYYQPEPVQSSCLICPSGHRCPNPDGEPIKCGNGTYSLSGSVRCTTCQAGTFQMNEGQDNCSVCLEGYSCPGIGTIDPIICMPGTIALQGSSECTVCSLGRYSVVEGGSLCQICPNGSYCPTPDQLPVSCPLGQFSNSLGATTCQSCLAGTFANVTGSTTCVGCLVGHECPEGSAAPLVCFAGEYSDTTGLRICKKCETGSYNVEFAEIRCYPCPAGYSCVATNVEPAMCPVGTYSEVGVSICKGCELGDYTVTNGSTQCSACPRDHKCEFADQPPTPCPTGLFSLPGSTKCSASAQGTVYNSTTGLADPCSVGTYYNGTACLDCPKGFACQGFTAQPQSCVNNTYQSATGQSACLSCPGGSSCLDVSAPPVKCNAGQYSPEGNSVCMACDSRHYSEMGYEQCLPCTAGYYCTSPARTKCPSGSNSKEGDGTCTSCPTGEHTNGSDGATVCQPCPAGSECSDSTLAPVRCNDGEYSANGDATCSSCPAGTFCSDPALHPDACPSGEYSMGMAGATGCLKCPAGQSCVNPAGAPTNCLEGTYSLEGDGKCKDCPAGSSCASTSTSPATCFTGEYSLSGNSTCYPCPVGYICVNSSVSPLKCPPGTTTEGKTGQVLCTDCPAGSACSDPTTLPVACSTGSYVSTGGADCEPCPAGASCSGSSATACTPGTYAVVGNGSCTSCPSGYSCPYTNQAYMHQCEPGTYSLGSQAYCTPCPAGFECPDTAAATVNSCGVGYYSLGSQESCTICPAGQQCPRPDGSGNTYCLPGTYAIAGKTSCETCAAGKACPFTNSDETLTCASGTYSGPNQTQCTRCPAGQQCSNTNTANGGATSCDSGSYSVGGKATCTECVAGEACPTIYTAFVVICQLGSYSLAKEMACTSCPAGEECPSTRVAGTACADGFYSLGKQTACTPCPAGYECSAKDSLPVKCPAGTYASAESITCPDCDAGYYCSEASTSKNPANDICPLGYYCTGGTNLPAPCPAGFYGDKIGLTTQGSCPQCPLGYYCEEGTPGIPDVNTICPKGFYCPVETACSAEHPCPAGTYGPNVQQQDEATACVTCPAGRYCQRGSSQPGVPCPRGHYCESGTGNPANPGGIKEPIPCNAGKYTAEEGARTIDSCVDCPAGYYCLEGSANPTSCPPGTYQPDVQQPSSANCRPCTAGMACTVAGLTEPNYPCSPGYYCPVGSALYNNASHACPAGTYTDEYNLTASDQCQTCPARFACLEGTGGTNQKPIKCAPGYFCSNGTTSDTEHPCPAGSYSNKTNLASWEECWECPRGFYCLEGSSSPTDTCPMGYYCPAGTQSSNQYPCSAGSFSNKTGNVRWEDCDDCIEGYYCGEGSSTPQACSPGSYNSVTNSDGPEDCTDCDAGYYCPDNGTTVPVACGKGMYSASGKSACDECLAGHYCDEETTTENLLANKTCPAGMHCPPGTDQAPNLYNSSCPAGFYCERGDLNAYPQPCEVGTFSDKTGLKYASNCAACTEGKYCDVENLTAPAGNCPPGYYCPTGTGASDSFPCPAGTFLNGTAAVSSDSCSQCTSGHYCPENGTSEPTICPTGAYCEPGRANYVPCPEGTYNNRTGVKSTLECTRCPGGKYCLGVGNEVPSGDCQEGYYCVKGATTATPSDGTTGDVCTSGGYCTTGSAFPQACPPGKYSMYQMAISIDNCSDCMEGKFCSGLNSVGITGDCSPGYYCTGGASTSIQFAAQPGYYAGEGSVNQTACARGYYSPTAHAPSCMECPLGQYCNETAMAVSIQCPSGNYCPTKSEIPTPCPSGTYNSDPGQPDLTACTDCDVGQFCNKVGLSYTEGPCTAGFYCGVGSTTPIPNGTQTSFDGGPCPVGHYCVSGTLSPTPCPAGKYNNNTQGYSIDSCLDCPPGRSCAGNGLIEPNGYCTQGYYCSGNASLSTPPVDPAVPWGGECQPGYYCPVGSPSQTECPPGNYSTAEKAVSCEECPAGSQCIGGQSIVACPAGFYCPAGTGLSPERCPPGTYMDGTGASKIDDCKPCDAGYYCGQWNQTTSITTRCDAGYFCRSGVNVSDPSTADFSGDGGRCPAGSYCPIGTGEPVDCPNGTYSNQEGLEQLGKCKDCDAGKYCSINGLTEPNGNCTAGFFCSGGSSVSMPTGNGGNQCSPGYYCPEGTVTELRCPPGGYSNSTGLAECTPCVAGFYCPGSTVDYTENPCPAGYFCPEGTKTYLDNPCPPGTYGTASGLAAESSCLPCDPGMYCRGNGSTSASGSCDPGFYCITNSTTPQPSGYVNYTAGDSCLCPATDIGGMCPVGYFCPEGTGQPLPCSNGSYCETANLFEPTGPCDAGYYCNSSATRRDPEDGITGGICPPGYWCGVGTGDPKPCPAGTFSSGRGLESEGNCTQCTPGYFCENPPQTIVTAECFAGFYCPAGESVGNRLSCPPGHMCPVGSSAPVLCDSGQYQDENQTENCKVCPAGFYCDRNDGPISDYTLYPCPLGSYCLNGTRFSTEYLCPPGTYGMLEKQESVDDCLDCPVGKYCPNDGMTSNDFAGNSFDCAAGYFCISGANISTPEDDVTGRPCSKGHYCNPGATTETNCMTGTFNNMTGQGFSGACVDCTPGFYCDSPARETPNGPCYARYYCDGGDTVPAPPDKNCTIGHFCPEQTAKPIPCYDGTYNLDIMAIECLNCTAGRYCVDGLTESSCPQGYYCPSGTGNNWQSCPPGTYGQSARLQSSSDCQLCDPGKYCDEFNATTYRGDCSEGFYCRNGSISANPDGTDGVNGLCSPGHYCPAGIPIEQNCPAGTYSNESGLINAEQCSPCPPGFYCEEGMSAPTGDCAARYYCRGNATSSMPSMTDATGGLCPLGYSCPPKTANPLPCQAGTYNNLPGQEECFQCPSGYYCPENTTDYSTYECPAGYYCPNGTSDQFEYPCPAGTYNNATVQHDLRGCRPCPPGKFCNTSGLIEPSGNCNAGWYCTLCSLSPTPAKTTFSGSVVDTTCLCPVQSDVNSTGGECQPGYFCEEGSNAPTPCTAGHYCETAGLASPTNLCNAGFYCIGGASRPAPTDGVTGDECPMGHYCEAGSGDKTPCNSGTFSNLTRNKSPSDCSTCTAGFYCSGGEVTESGPCGAGYYCPEGQNISTPSGLECPSGNYCPTGVGNPIPCDSGTFQNQPRKESCNICPEAYYCEAINNAGVIVGVSVPSECPQGYFCPNGTEYRVQYGCPKGTYGDRGSLSRNSSCKDCDGGYFCDTIGANATSGDCLAGSYCTLGASSNAPRDNITGNICPRGRYCPAKTQIPPFCPKGTFGPTEGLKSSGECTNCTGGMYCQKEGLEEPQGNCTAGYYCPIGSQSSTAMPCPASFHCPAGSSDPLPCPPGSYTMIELQESCKECTAGSYCNGTGIEDCPRGYFCPNGTGAYLEPCPRGTYGDTTGLHRIDQCKDCDLGYFCRDLHATTFTGKCSPGYYCRSGSDSQTPSGNNTGDAGICPAGSYCEEGTGNPSNCLPGTFNGMEQATGPEYCRNCTSGSYCNTSGLSEPTGLCFEGFYCSGGTSNPIPSVVSSTGGPCPKGSFCEVGRSLPQPCNGGSYAPNIGMSACLPCPPGTYCPIGADATIECPLGAYCVANSSFSIPCTNGTYNNETGSGSADACQFCPPGYYCPNKGMENPRGKCAPGWYCILGSWMERPTALGINSTGECACPADGGIGGECQPGEYCPEGSNFPIPCDGGYFCDAAGLFAVTGSCQEGFYCSIGSSLEAPVGKTYGDVCSQGFYCPRNSSREWPCPIGSFSNTTQNTGPGDCQQCPGGWYCPSAGLPNPVGMCGVGFFCPPNSTEETPSTNKCPMGTACPVGSDYPTPCYSGTYQSDEGKGFCFECPAGLYCDFTEAIAAGLDGVVVPESCPRGYYCPPGTNYSTEFPCPLGTYSDVYNLTSEMKCTPCDEGYFCDQTNQISPTGECYPGYFCSNGSSSPTNEICPQGFYCPSGSPFAISCPEGTYGATEGRGNMTECSPCDPGYYCDTPGVKQPRGGCSEGFYCSGYSTEPNPVGKPYGDVCPSGTYCPLNSSQPLLCPSGTYNPSPQKSSFSDCLQCTPRSYCNGSGQSSVAGDCWEGYYCNYSATVPTQHDCTPGHYCPPASSSPQPCLNGTYSNTTNAITCEICPSGWYCPDEAVEPLPCPLGNYCPEGTGLETKKCPTGTYGPSVGLSKVGECTPCTTGSYCDVPGSALVGGQCDPGYNCVLGVDTSRPDNMTNKGSGGKCMLGYQCPNGVAESCPTGTFADIEGLGNCKQCREGFYCDGGTINSTECPTGSFCPPGTNSSTEYLCPEGTFNNETRQISASSCLLCTGGMYCPGVGNPEPFDQCDAGYYCVAGSGTKTPIVLGITSGGSNETCSNLFDCVCPTLADTIGGICTPGYYCPRGSDKPRECSDGMYCPDFQMEKPLGNCAAGYFCLNGSAVPDQNDCPPGFYCETGTGVPAPCPPGTYSSTFLNENSSYCGNCTSGMYCEGNHNRVPTGNCSEGFYCPGGDSTAESFTCSRNHRCPIGSIDEIVCEAGTYQPAEGQSSCIPCQVQYICDPYSGATLDPEECPTGHYCPEGTQRALTCPPGTYRDVTKGGREEDCWDCPGGQYCAESDGSVPSGDCYGGYYCTGKAKIPNPYLDNVNLNASVATGNSICPAGSYCPNGTSIPIKCDIGTYSQNTGRSLKSDCLPCPAGKYCDYVGRVNATTAPDCDPGYLCVSGAITQTPNDATGYQCPEGFYCPSGTTVSLGCPPGSYGPNPGAESCIICPAGSVCASANMSATDDCPPGFYCPYNTSIPEACPESTYYKRSGAKNISDCLPCDPGYFCNGTGNANVSGPCSAGYLCKRGSSTPTPSGSSISLSPYNGPCPEGLWCGSGATAGTNCPPGTMRNATGAASEADCLPCEPGHYCLNPGQSRPTGPCNCGSYCPGNDSNTSPSQYPCPVGNYCPSQSSKPLPCGTGNYQPNPSECVCISCRPGFFCQDSLSGGQIACPAHNYCPEGVSFPILCPSGTYTNDTAEGLANVTQCEPCPTGKYCTGGEISGDCNAGFYCESGAYSPTANGTDFGPCAAGFYCEVGETDPKPCPENTIRTYPGASKVEDCEFCPPGKWCRSGIPVVDDCPAGYFCSSLNTSDCTMDAGPQPCPLYTYRNNTGGINEADCIPCPAGFSCNETGLSDYQYSACDPGYYCNTTGGQSPTKCPAGTLRQTPGAGSVEDCSSCTAGYYCPDPATTGVTNVFGIPCDPGYQCPMGSIDQKLCTAGYYCLEKTSIPDICPAGYVCPSGSSSFSLCVYPFYCPEGTGDPLPCDVGYQPLNISGLRGDLTEACMICPVGTYRNSSNDDKCQVCPPGFFCPEGTGNYQKNPCPVGHYCPEGGVTAQGGVTGFPIACPAGTFGQQSGSVFSVCQLCPAGLYNNKEGQAACFPCGSSATSVEGSVECTCQGFNRAFQSSDGSCVCQSGYVYYDETDTLQDEGNSQFSCEAIVNTRCATGETRIASDRSCATVSTYSCEATCVTGTGAMNVDLGTCLCDSVTVPEEIQCAVGCYTMSTSLNSATGVLTITTTSTSDGSETTASVPNVYGPTDKISSAANTFLLSMGPSGIFAVPPTENSTASSLVGSTQQDITSSFPTARRRRSLFDDGHYDLTIARHFGRRILQTSAGNATIPPTVTIATGTPAVISNPVICLQINEMLIFNLNINDNRELSNYPVYVRNHLYNTNPNFDYGAFRQLQTYITQTTWNVTNFAHVFLEPGIYVFADAQQPAQELIVNVLQNGLLCDASRIQPATISSLTRLGVSKQSVTNLTPDWILIAVLLALFGLCVIVLVIAVIVWRPRDAGIYPMLYWKPRYRSLGEPYVPPYKILSHTSHDTREGLGLIRERGEAEGAEADVLKDEQLLEDFNVRTLYDKLEDQNLHLSSQMTKHQNSLQGFYEKISNQTEGLKTMLKKLDVSKLEAAELARSSAGDAAPSVVHTTVNMSGREFKLAGGSSLREKELLHSLESLITKLNTGKITVSDEVLNDARNRLQGLDSKETAKMTQSANISGVNREDWKTHGQTDLIKAQQSDKIDLSRELVAGERDAITNLLITQDDQRKKLMSDMDNKLAFKMQGDLSESEMNALLSEHERELENALNALNREKKRQMNELKEQLEAKRKARKNQLQEAHAEQCKEADMPMPSEEEDADSDDLSIMEKQLEAAVLEESASASKEEAETIGNSFKDEGVKLSKTFGDELDAMVASGMISADVRDQLRKQLGEQEDDLKSRMEQKKQMQFRTMKDRMAERKRRRMQKLKEQQEQEKALTSDVTPEMEERHDGELKALEAELDAEEASLERDMVEAIETEHQDALKELHKELINEMSEKHGLDPVAQQELMDRYRREIDNYDHVNEMKRTQQSQDLQAKLAAKRARRAADIQKTTEERLREHARDEEQRRLQELTKLREAQDTINLAGDGLDIPDIVMADNLEVQALVREHERVLVDTESQQASDTEQLIQDLDKREKDDLEGLEKILREEKERALRETQAKHEAEARARTNLSEEQTQQLLAAHQQELGDLERNLEKQQSRQRAALREKMTSRRKRKAALLRQRQEIEKETEKIEQRKELAQVQAKTAKDAERDAIIEGIERNGAASSERVIQRVLEKRQAQELKDLEEEFALKKKLLLEEALRVIKEQYQAEREAMLSKHENELQKLESEGLSAEEFAKRKEELIQEHQTQLSELDKNHKKSCKATEQSTTAEWNLEYSQAKLKLKEKHYQEFAEALRELAPSASQQQTAEEAEKSAKRLEETKQRLEQERTAAEKKLAQERLDLEEEEKQRIALAMKEFENDLEKETEQDKIKAEKSLNTLAKRKEKLLKDKREKIREEIDRAASAGVSEEEQKKILEQHEKDVENLTNKIDRERLRMKTQLEERLKQKRKDKITAKKEELENESKKSQKEIDAKQKAELQKVQEEQIKEMQHTAKAMEEETKAREAEKPKPPLIKEIPQTAPAVAPVPPPPAPLAAATTFAPDYDAMNVNAGMAMIPYALAAPAISEEELHKMLLTSPLYQTLQEVQGVLNKEKKSERIGGESKFLGPDINSGDTDLIPTPLSDLNVRELVAYKFGTFILGLLRTRRTSHPPINLLVAEKVPAQPDLKQNAFRGSFCFDEGNGILYIKRDRLVHDSIGRLSLLLVHIAAHIATGSLDDDSSPTFVQEFYHCLAVLSDDLFFARHRDELQKSKQDSVKLSATQDVLEIRLPARDISTPSIASADAFRQKGLHERIDKYAHTVVSSMVREELGNIEEKVKQARTSGTLDEIDNKLSSLLPPTPASSQSTRRPDTRGIRPITSPDEDYLNAEFLNLTQEAGKLEMSLASADDVTVRNRLTNVRVRLSDVQKRLRTTS